MSDMDLVVSVPCLLIEASHDAIQAITPQIHLVLSTVFRVEWRDRFLIGLSASRTRVFANLELFHSNSGPMPANLTVGQKPAPLLTVEGHVSSGGLGWIALMGI